ncbi:hypothetical protein IWQ61_007033 [Dispira simplex]|nr:hypothetical protein IWQ61_007033 [Dispira simplex]
MGILTLAYQRVTQMTLGRLSPTSALEALKRPWAYAFATGDPSTPNPKSSTETANPVLHHGKVEAAVTLVLRAVQKDMESGTRDIVLQLYQVALELLSEALLVPLRCFPLKTLKVTGGLTNENRNKNKTDVKTVKETKGVKKPTALPPLDESWGGLPEIIPVVGYINTVVGILWSWIHWNITLFRQFVDTYPTIPIDSREGMTRTIPLPTDNSTIDPWGLRQGIISAAQQAAIWLKRSPLPSLVLFWFYFGRYILRILDQHCQLWWRLRAWATWCLIGLAAWTQHYRIHHHIIQSGITLVTALARGVVAYRATDSYYTIPIPTWFTQ